MSVSHRRGRGYNLGLSIVGIESLVRKLRNRVARLSPNKIQDCTVGYTASYALFVHENMIARHKAPGRSKFLEIPYRIMLPSITRMIAKGIQTKKTFGQAILDVGLRLLRESQKIVPVDTGLLHDSGFVSLNGRDTTWIHIGSSSGLYLGRYHP